MSWKRIAAGIVMFITVLGVVETVVQGWDDSATNWILAHGWMGVAWIASKTWSMLLYRVPVWWVLVGFVLLITLPIGWVFLLDRFKPTSSDDQSKAVTSRHQRRYRTSNFWGIPWQWEQHHWGVGAMTPICPECKDELHFIERHYGTEFSCGICGFRGQVNRVGDPVELVKQEIRRRARILLDGGELSEDEKF